MNRRVAEDVRIDLDFLVDRFEEAVKLVSALEREGMNISRSVRRRREMNESEINNLKSRVNAFQVHCGIVESDLNKYVLRAVEIAMLDDTYANEDESESDLVREGFEGLEKRFEIVNDRLNWIRARVFTK